MRKIIVSEFVTLDGVMEAPDQWSFQFWSEAQAEFKFAELSASDALLLGRVTYEDFAAAWPHMSEEATEIHADAETLQAELADYARMMNDYPKYVISRTLTDPLEWNNSTLIKENVVDEVTRLKQQPGQDILIFGSGELVNSLMQHDLIDEYRLMIFPIKVGSGKRLFPNGSTQNLTLVENKQLSSDVVVLTYQPAKAATQ